MKKNNYRITVLLDLRDSKGSILKSAAVLAKMIHGEIDVFHVRKPSDIVENDNQLSAMRTINSEHTLTDKKIRKLIAPISKDYGVVIRYSFVFGNVKNAIGDYLKENRPDIIVLGKRKPNLLKFIGDDIREFVLNTYKGTILIAPNKNPLKPNKEISLGILNSTESSINLEFSDDLLVHAQKPLKSFKFVKPASGSEDVHAPAAKNTIAYVFEHNDSAIKNLTKYISKNKIDLLFIDRAKKQTDDNVSLMVSDIKNLVARLNVALLVSNP